MRTLLVTVTYMVTHLRNALHKQFHNFHSHMLSMIVDPHVQHINLLGERAGLVVNDSDSGSKGRGFEPHSGQTVLCP